MQSSQQRQWVKWKTLDLKFLSTEKAWHCTFSRKCVTLYFQQRRRDIVLSTQKVWHCTFNREGVTLYFQHKRRDIVLSTEKAWHCTFNTEGVTLHFQHRRRDIVFSTQKVWHCTFNTEGVTLYFQHRRRDIVLSTQKAWHCTFNGPSAKTVNVVDIYLCLNFDSHMGVLLLLTCTSIVIHVFNPFTAEVAIMRLLGSAPKSHLCDQRRRSKVTGLSDLVTLFIDLGCLYCKQMQRAFNVFNTR
jgi:hypothetical protein